MKTTTAEQKKDYCHEAAARVARMEVLFDLLASADVDAVRTDPVLMAARDALSDYLSGEWLADYELDEQGALPADLKRGVLAQDGLYELLHCIEENE